MIVLFDTNIVLDVLLDRPPHAEAASRLFAAVETGRLSGLICATTVTTVHYLATKSVGDRRARTEISRLLELFNIAPVTRIVLEDALTIRGFADFEDAVVHEAARHSGATSIVTRNGKDFARAKLAVFDPLGLLEVLGASGT